MSVSGELLQEADEWREYVAHDVIVDLPEHIEDWRTAYDWSRRREAYAQGSADVQAHFLLWVDGFEGASTPPRYLCATFHRACDTSNFTFGDEQVDVLGLGGCPSEALSGSGDHVQDAMLVEPIEFMQAPKGIVRKCVPSVVRLQPLDGLLSDRRDPLDLCEATARRGGTRELALALQLVEPGRTPTGSVLKDREFGFLLDLIGERHSERRRQFECEMIERRAEALQTVSDEQSEGIGGQRRRVDPSAVSAQMLRIWLLNDGLLCSLDPVIDCALTPLQVVLRP